jgi:hypothetical protein
MKGQVKFIVSTGQTQSISVTTGMECEIGITMKIIYHDIESAWETGVIIEKLLRILNYLA